MMKPLGTPQSPVEETIEAIVAEAPIFDHGRGATYGPISGGISNENWRVRTEAGGDYFVKVPGNGTEMFIDREAAFEASQKAAAAGIGPRVYDDLFSQGIEINDYMADRRPSTHSDFLRPDIRHATVNAYRAMHDLPRLEHTKTVFDMIDEHLRQRDDLAGPRIRDEPWVMLNTRMAREAIEAAGYDMVPCFNDPMPGNFMIGPDSSVKLIDYEYASLNDRCYDLALWFGEMFFTPEQELALIEAYFGNVRPEIVSRIIVHKALADVKWSLWALVQLRVSRLSFDFYKYGMWKLMRFRQIVWRDEWPLHLRRL